MSACPAEEEWKTVSKKKGVKKRRNNVRDRRGFPHEIQFLSVAEGQRIQQKIKDAVEELRSSEFWTDCLETIRRAVNEYRTAPLASPSGPSRVGGAPEALEYEKDDADHCGTMLDMVCYGIGNFSSSVSSRYQLALLFLLLETLQEGKRSVDRPTLFYMVHCGKALYNNLLWKNWSPQKLAQTILIGNSFKGIEERLPARMLQRDYTYISHILAVTEEAAFPSCSRYMDVFNDTAIHQFPRKKLDAKSKEFWEGAAEPTYQQCEDLEIIQSGLECLSVS
uniref:SRR1-like protein isoform X2 n=1 Tax=Pristiophorus japonicus TaxID=55135 RepID=UPI00398E6E99